MKRSSLRFLLVVTGVGIAALGCGPKAAPPPAPVAAPPAPVSPRAQAPSVAPADPAPPAFRLGEDVVPVEYAVDLTVVPERDGFSGAVTVELDVRKPTAVVWLNGRGLSVSQAALEVGGETWPARAVTAGDEYLGFVLPRDVPVGRARLRVAYTGAFETVDAAGAFKQKEGDDWYVVTQFEPTDARRVIPCFDEPSFKVPWQLTLRVPAGEKAVSNTPVESEAPSDDGLRTVRFARTKPLPSYLVAFAVGPFDVVDLGAAGKNPTPMRLYVFRGRGADTRFAAEAHRELLVRLEEYFGMGYPYEKLDAVAVPQTIGWSAMENPGMVTYNGRILVARPEEETPGFKRGAATVIAHELGHQWFGNYVTLAWWNDIWLNEAFASWIEDKMVHAWKPEWELDVSNVAARGRSMAADSLVSARQIRQPIRSRHDIANAFDGITYGKGAAVLHMFESWIGEAAFRDGVRAYLAAHAHRTATSEDFISALARAAGPQVEAAFASFLEQPGVPLVEADLVCEAGRTPRLALSQRRYLPTGSRGSSAQTWRVPVCARWGIGPKSGRACTLLAAEKGELVLEGADACPDWILPNEGAHGYYRVKYEGAHLARLLGPRGPRLSFAERLGVLDDASALVASGHLQASDVLALVPALVRTKNRHIIARTVNIVSGLDEHLISESLRPRYARFIRKLYGAQARELGFAVRPDEDEATQLMRGSIVSLVAVNGEDGTLAKEALALANAWLDDRKAIDDQMVEPVLEIAAHHGDAKLFERFLAAARASKDRKERARLLGALANFRPPELAQRVLDLAISGEFEVREATRLLFGPFANPHTRELAYAFLKQNFDKISAAVPKDWGAYLMYAGSAFCDEEHRADVEAFFSPKAASFTGGPRVLAQVLERITLCDANRRAQEASVSAFLQKF